MIRYPVTELGQRRPAFTRPDLPAPEVAGKCSKCGGGTRAEEYDSWSGGNYARKRTYRCIQHRTRCPAHTVIVGQDGQEETKMAKTVTCTQTQSWCEETKAAMVAKHLAYRDVAKDAAISCSALSQGLTMRMSLAEETQARITAAIANADPVEAKAARDKAASRKPKAKATVLPGSLQGPPPEKVMAWAAEMEKESVQGFLAVQEALHPGAAVTWSEEQPKPGLLQTEMLEHSVENLQQALGTGAVRPPVCGCGGLATEMGGRCAACQRDHDVNQRLTALEQSAEEMDIGQVQVCKRIDDLEDRLTQTYDHLTESMANMQPLVVSPQLEPQGFAPGSVFAEPSPLAGLRTSTIDEDSLKWWIDERDQPLTPDKLVKELSLYSDSQLAAMVAAAAARREMFKALEAA